MITHPSRDYGAISVGGLEGASREARMRAVVEAIWSAFQRRQEGDGGVSWVGFYLAPGQRTPERDVVGDAEMVLAVREPKPACSPIGLHGACGQCWSSGRALVVSDVARLGDGYVACDPRDRSEIVMPCFDVSGACWGVLDLDSFDVGAFSDHDAAGLAALLERAGLSVGSRSGGGARVV